MISVGTKDGIPFHRFGDGSQSLVIIPGVMDALGWNTPSKLTGELLSRYYFRAFMTYDIWVLSRPPGLPSGVTLDRVTSRYAEVIEALGGAHVLGLTLGGAIGVQLASRYPALVDKLVLAACGTTLGVTGREILLRWRALARKSRWDKLHAAYARQMYTGAASRIVPVFYRLGNRFVPGPVVGSDVVQSCDLLLDYDARASAEAVDASTLVVADTTGPLFPQQDQRDLAGRLKHGHLATIAGGHTVYEESRRTFGSVVRRFLDEQHTH